jgi:hypothetical protein
MRNEQTMAVWKTKESDDDSVDEIEELVSANDWEPASGMRQTIPKRQFMVSLGFVVLILSVSTVYCRFSGKNAPLVESSTTHKIEAAKGMTAATTSSPPGSSPSRHPTAHSKETTSNTAAAFRRYQDSPIAARQIDSFRKGSGIIVNFHITHHAGTAVCQELGANLKHPSFACMSVLPEDGIKDGFPWKQTTWDWDYNSTASNIAFIQQYFRLIAFEFSKPPRGKVCTGQQQPLDRIAVRQC